MKTHQLTTRPQDFFIRNFEFSSDMSFFNHQPVAPLLEMFRFWGEPRVKFNDPPPGKSGDSWISWTFTINKRTLKFFSEHFSGNLYSIPSFWVDGYTCDLNTMISNLFNSVSMLKRSHLFDWNRCPARDKENIVMLYRNYLTHTLYRIARERIEPFLLIDNIRYVSSEPKDPYIHFVFHATPKPFGMKLIGEKRFKQTHLVVDEYRSSILYEDVLDKLFLRAFSDTGFTLKENSAYSLGSLLSQGVLKEIVINLYKNSKEFKLRTSFDTNVPFFLE